MPQVWIAALLTLTGVGFLELGPGGWGPDALSGLGAGDAWAVLQDCGCAMRVG